MKNNNIFINYNIVYCYCFQILSCFMILALFAFFCQISDPRFGGTYMTLFNTFYFSGWLLSNTLALKLVDIFTINACSVDISNTCSTQNLTNVRLLKTINLLFNSSFLIIPNHHDCYSIL